MLIDIQEPGLNLILNGCLYGLAVLAALSVVPWRLRERRNRWTLWLPPAALGAPERQCARRIAATPNPNFPVAGDIFAHPVPNARSLSIRPRDSKIAGLNPEQISYAKLTIC